MIKTNFHQILPIDTRGLTLSLLLVLAFVSTDNVAQTHINEQDSMTSLIADDEVIQFFRTTAIYDSNSEQWRVPIHGWVYKPQKSQFRKALFSWAINAKYNLQVSEDAQANYNERLNLLIADNERGKKPLIQIADQDIPVVTASTPNGHFAVEIFLPKAVVDKFRQANVLPYSAKAKDGREFFGQVLLVAEQGLSVISDIDDTIKISDVTNHQRLVDNTFLKPFAAVPGMSQAYQQLANQVSSFHFVSSSPWQFYHPLDRFVAAEKFPLATFSLKAIRFRDMTLFDLFKPGTETKPLQIENLLNALPLHHFILIGDNGEQDPEVYAGILADHPARIEKIFIRNITGEKIDNERFKSLVTDPGKWVFFEDPAVIRID